MSAKLKIGQLEQFLDDNGNALYNYICSLCHNKEDADDVLQSVFVKFLEQVKKGAIVKETALNYIIRMARNEHYGRLRKLSREEALLDEDGLMSDGSKVHREQTSRQIRIVLLEALASPNLPRDIAEMLFLRFVEEADVDTISKKVGKSKPTVYRLMEAALPHLQRAFEKAGLKIEDLESY